MKLPRTQLELEIFACLPKAPLGAYLADIVDTVPQKTNEAEVRTVLGSYRHLLAMRDEPGNERGYGDYWAIQERHWELVTGHVKENWHEKGKEVPLRS